MNDPRIMATCISYSLIYKEKFVKIQQGNSKTIDRSDFILKNKKVIQLYISKYIPKNFNVYCNMDTVDPDMIIKNLILDFI